MTQGPGRVSRNSRASPACEVVEGARSAAVGTPAAREHLLHEGLGALEQGAVGPGPEDGLTRGAQTVGQAVDQRGFGPDDVEVGLDLLEPVHSVHLDRAGHAGIARRDDHVGGAGQRVGAARARGHRCRRRRPSRGGEGDGLLAPGPDADQSDRDADLLGRGTPT